MRFPGGFQILTNDGLCLACLAKLDLCLRQLDEHRRVGVFWILENRKEVSLCRSEVSLFEALAPKPARDFHRNVHLLVFSNRPNQRWTVLQVVVTENDPQRCPLSVLRFVQFARSLKTLDRGFVILVLECRPTDPEVRL